jgi:microcystin degradation protein MlrC
VRIPSPSLVPTRHARAQRSRHFVQIHIQRDRLPILHTWLWSLWANSKPVMAKFDCRMIEVLPTSTQPMRGFADRMMAMEAHSELSGLSEIKSHIPGDPEILSVSCIHGFMAADVECMGSAMLVITDNQPEKGAGLAQKLGMELFELRGTTRPEYLHPQAGIDRAVAEAWL